MLTLNYADQIVEQVGFFPAGFTPEQLERIKEFGATCAERGYALGYGAGATS